MRRLIPIILALAFAFSNTALGQNISIKLRNNTVEQALEMLKEQQGLSYMFQTKDVDLSRKITAEFKDSSIEDVLKAIFAGQDVLVRIDGKMVNILPKEVAQAVSTVMIDVTGVVKDNSGLTVQGAVIKVKGTNDGCITDANGQFSITIAKGNTLICSCLGYDEIEKTPVKSGRVDFTVAESMNELEESVIIGYGSVKKSDLTGAVSSVKSSELLASSNISVSTMLAGRAAGVTAIQTSAQPGGGVSLLIRGAASTGAGNDPLYIIDGFPINGSNVEPGNNNRYTDFGSHNPLNSINPNDIQSIEILKDASSTAIYGARAANGVVIITTKNGYEGRPVVNYSASYGIQQIARKTEVMNATDFMLEANAFAKEKWLYDNQIYPYGKTDPSTVISKANIPYTEAQIANAGEGTDWYDLVTQQGMINQHNISVFGGSSKLKYMASFNYYDQNGVVKNSDFTRFSGRLNLEHQLNNIFSWGVTATKSHIKSSNIPLGTEDFENSGLLNAALAYDPTVPVKDAKGNYSISPLMAAVPNPVSLLEIDDHTTTNRFLVDAWLKADILPGLSAKINLGLDEQSGMRNAYLPKTTLYGLQEGGKASKSYASELDKLFEGTLNYNVKFGDGNHVLNVLAGYSYQDFKYESLSAANTNFFTDLFLYNSLATGEGARPTVGSGQSINVLKSYFGRVNYNLLDKYLFTFTARVDGSSKFGSNNKYGFFPSGAVAWKVKNEDFLKDIEWISEMKLRVSLGQTGNSNIGNNAFEYYTSAWRQYVFGDKVSTGTGKSQLANPDLKWETTTEFNVGADLGFLDQRISVVAEYFTKEVADLLGYRTLKSFMEVSTVAANIGSTQSSGVELTLHTRNFTGEFRWDTDLTFTRYVDRWKERNPENNLNPWQKTDDPIRSLYGYLADGILQPDEEVPESMPGLLPGSFKIKDVNGYVRDGMGNLVMDANGKVQYLGRPDGKIDEADIVLYGTTDPGFSMGLNNTFSYKGFDLNIFFYGLFDRMVSNATRSKYSIPEIRRILTGQNMMYDVRNRWSSTNMDAELPSGFTSAYPQPGTYLYEKGWFIRCKNITLGYTVPDRFAGRIFSKARVYVQLENPFLITEYTGNDPETDFKAGYPNQHTFMAGIDLTF